MTVLYLNALNNLRLRIDGPALVVQTEGQATRLFPLDRLERIHLPASYCLETAVLTACFRAGICIALCESKGRVLGWCIPTGKNGDRKSATIMRFSDRAGSAPLYRKWQAQCLQDWKSDFIHYLQLPLASSIEIIQQELLRLAIHYAGKVNALRAWHWLAHELQGGTLVLLQEQGLDGDTALYWAERLTSLLRLRMAPVLMHWLEYRHGHMHSPEQNQAPLKRHEFMIFLNRHQDRLEKATADLVESLFAWMEAPNP